MTLLADLLELTGIVAAFVIASAALLVIACAIADQRAEREFRRDRRAAH